MNGWDSIFSGDVRKKGPGLLLLAARPFSAVAPFSRRRKLFFSSLLGRLVTSQQQQVVRFDAELASYRDPLAFTAAFYEWQSSNSPVQKNHADVLL